MTKQTRGGCRVSRMACRALLGHGIPNLQSSILSLLLLLAAGLLAGTAQAATKDWVGTTTNMSTAANWSPTNVPGTADIARWNSSSYPYQPYMTAGLTIGQLLFGDGNSGAVTIGGSSGLTLNRLEGVGIQMTNGAVTINAPITLGNSLSFINNNPSPGNALTLTSALSGAKRLTVSGSGDTIVSDLTGGGTLTMNGTGTLTLSGSVNNNQTMTLVNSGTVKFNKGGTARVLAGSSGPALVIGRANATPATVQYTGASTNMIGSGTWVTILGGGRLDFNGGTQYPVAKLIIESIGAGGNTTPITNSGSGGTLYLPNTYVLPLPGFTTTLDSGSGTNVMNGSTLYSCISDGGHNGLSRDGRVQINGKINLLSASFFQAYNGDAADDLTINAAISGTAGVGFTVGGARVVLTGDNSGVSGPVTLSTTMLNIRHGNALGTNLTTVGSGSTLELQNNIAVGAQPLSLNGTGYGTTVGALRNVSGNNSWGGSITQAAASRINSDSGTLTLTNTVSLANVALTVGGLGNVTMSTNCIMTSTGTGGTLTKDGAGILTLSGTNTFTGITYVLGGMLVLDYSNLTNSKLADGAALTLSKGTLTLSGGNHTEVVSSVNVGIGTGTKGGSFAVTRSGGSSVLRMNAITRNNGAAIDFSADGLADTDTPNVNGILGVGYATVGGNTWAYNSTGAGDGPINGLPDSGYVANAANLQGSTASTSNLDMRTSSQDTTVTNIATINSIRFNSAEAKTITINAGKSLTVTSGGILNTAAVGNNLNTITGDGTLSATVVHQYNTSNTLRIDSIASGAYFTKTGPGKLILGGSSANSFSGAVYVNGGELDLDKSAGTAAAIPVALTINQTGIVKYINAYGDQIGAIAVTIYENGQLDFNGATDTIGNVAIGNDNNYSTGLGGASGNTTPIKNSTPTSGNLTIGTLGITPQTGCETLIDTGSGGTLKLGGTVTFTAAGSGVARLSGNLSLNNATRDFSVADGEALNDMVIDAIITGGGSSGALTKSGVGRLVLGGANNYTGTTTVNAGILTITNALALGTADNGTTVTSGYTLELRDNITVAAEPLTLNGVGVTVNASLIGWASAAGALRNYSGNNTWGGPITLGATARISSDYGSLLTLTNTVSGAGFGLEVAGLGDVTINGAISNVPGLTNRCLGTLTLGGAAANAIASTVVRFGTVILNKTSGAAVSNLTITSHGNWDSIDGSLNDTAGIVRYAANSTNNQINGTVTLASAGVGSGAGQLDFNGATDTVAVVTINSTGAIADSRPIVNTGNGGQLTINALNITPVAEYITKLDSGTNGVLRLGGDVTFTAATTGQGTISGSLDLGGATRTFNCVGLGTGPIYDLGISAVIGNGALTKIGAGRLYLSGVNAYAGDTLVSAGTLLVTGSITNSPNVTVAKNATLQTDSANALGANAALALVSDGLGANFGKANLNFVGTQTVAVLRFDGVTQAGTWGSSSSTAANTNNNWFSGTGVIQVNGPQIQNEAVANVTDTAATFNGWLVSGGPATVGVLWGTTDGGSSGAWANTNWFDGTVTDNTHLSTNIASLTTGIPYYYTFVASNATAVVRAAPSVAFVPQGGTTKVWLTTGTTDWGTSANWTPAGAPDANCNVIINTAGGNQPVLNLSGGPFTIRSLSIGATAVSRLTFQNGDVLTKRLIVTNDVVIGANGTLTHVLGTAHALYLDVSNNFSIASGGRINVDAKGDSVLGAPGARAGPGHGGEGAKSGAAGGTTYGSITNPVLHGSAGSVYGGGVVMLRVGGNFANNGTITAMGGNSGSSVQGGGSGGSINLTVAGAMTMPSSASISVNGGLGDDGEGGNDQGGGGGRIAVLLTGVGQTFDNVARSKITAYGGSDRINGFGGPDIGGAVPFAGAGTVYLKTQDQSYGDVIVDNSPAATSHANNGRTLFKDYSYRFASITLTNRGEFVIGTNAALDLSGCTLRGDSTTNSIGSRLVVGTAGSAVTWSGAFTNSACISWTGTNGVSGTGDVTVTSGGILTHEYGSANAIKLSLVGDLTLDAGSAVWTKGLSDFSIGSPSDAAGGSHGGVGETGNSGLNNKMPTYGSITNPVTAGGKSLNESSGGGVAIIRASGKVTLNSYINVNGDGSGRGGGAGGSVNIVAAELRGNGSISANGSIGNYNNLYGGAGGGGRIAVVLTNSMTFTNVSFSAVGCGIAGNAYPDSGAGTIYLKGTNQAYGLLIVSNTTSAASESTLINTQVTDAVVGDVRILGTAYTRLALSNDCTLTVYGSWSNAVATNAISGGTVVFAGTDPNPVTVWGGNTWSNLTITTAGKQVQFQTNVIQYVYGTPAWSNNVSLLPIQNGYVDGTYWKLFKPSWGATQDVGVVTVQWSDALVSTGATFRAAVGSSVSNSRNWVVLPPRGTLIMLR